MYDEDHAAGQRQMVGNSHLLLYRATLHLTPSP